MTIPWSVRLPVRRARNAAARARLVVRQRERWRAIASTPAAQGRIAVSYGVERMPTQQDVVIGGHVKFALLDEALPNAPRDFNVLYIGSTSMPLDASTLVRLARRRGAAFVWNQNGVAYRGWYGPGWRLVNAPRARLLHQADYVFFQSAFCRLGSDRFYGERLGPSEVLHNPVDLRRFEPAHERPKRPLVLLLGGSQYQRYRIETALQTLALVRRTRPDARLMITGDLSFAPDGMRSTVELIAALGLDDSVDFVGPYTRAEAAPLLRRADLLLHTKYNDPCPTVVLEALATGLPVVYSASGGTPELVGDDAGVGVLAPLDWEMDHPPTPDDLAAAVGTVADRLKDYAAAARERAKRFDSQRWIERHREVFETLNAR